MVVIRLARGGAKHRPFYRIVAADKRASRDGRFIEKLGIYNPVARGQEEVIRIDEGRLNHWLESGAEPSNRVAQLVKQHCKLKAALPSPDGRILSSMIVKKVKKKPTPVVEKPSEEESVEEAVEVKPKTAEEKAEPAAEQAESKPAEDATSGDAAAEDAKDS